MADSAMPGPAADGVSAPLVKPKVSGEDWIIVIGVSLVRGAARAPRLGWRQGDGRKSGGRLSAR